MSKNEIIAIEKKLGPTLKDVESIVVTDEASEKEATDILSRLNIIGDAMKAAKAKVYDPAWQTVVAIREEWKPKETKLESAVSLIRGKLSKYRTAAKAEADKKAAEIAARVGSGKGKLKVETAVKKMEGLDMQDGSVTSDAGVVKYKTVQKFKVIDLKLLPLDFHLADEVAIRKAMVAGQKLPGVEYSTEEVPMNFR